MECSLPAACTRFVSLSVEYDTLFQEDACLSPSNIGQMYRFKQMVAETKRDLGCHRLVLCTGQDGRSITLASFLIGSYMILCELATPAEVSLAIQPIADRLVGIDSGPRTFGEQVTFMDLLEAIHNGKAQGW